MSDRVLNMLPCPSIHYNKIQISRWLVTFYQIVFDKFPYQTSIYSTNLFGNQKLGNFEFKAIYLPHYLYGKCLQKNIKGIRELFLLSWAIKSYSKISQTQNKVRDKGTSKMHFRCVLRCMCVITHLSSPSLCLERYAVLKIWFSV